METFKPLAIASLPAHTGYAVPYFNAPNPVKVHSSALEVMTDLHYVNAAVLAAHTDLDSAMQKMIARGVRSLLVVDDAQDVVGIVTARDLAGERPEAVMQSKSVERNALQVQDIMTAASQVEVLALEEVLHARVGDIVETLKNSGRQHALVVEEDPIQGRPVIRGIFSASQIARQLGIATRSQDLSETFSEIDRAISGQ